MAHLKPAVARARCGKLSELVGRMPYPHRRRVFIDTVKGRVSAGFTVPETDDAADVSVKLRERGWEPYRVRLEPEQHAWVAVVMDWKRAA
jgi:hypothetical protein